MFAETEKQHEIHASSCNAAVHAVCSSGSGPGKGQQQHDEAVWPGVPAGGGVHLWRIQVEEADGRRADVARG